MNSEVIQALTQLEKERGIPRGALLEAIETALVSAFKRNYGSSQNVRVKIDPDTGDINVYAHKNVVEAARDPRQEISLDEARAVDPTHQVGDVFEVEVTPREFGRIAAQTAKQVVVQKIREAERGVIFEEYSNREGDVVTGIVQRREMRNVIVDLGRVEAVIPQSEQVQRETYSFGDRIKVYIVEARKTPKGPQVVVSRSHPGLLKRLLELEVPEIYDGTVEIKGIAREAGSRSKVAVLSYDPNVDAVGACVGPRGMRVQKIVAELRGEKIDIIQWHDDPGIYVSNALSPARVILTRVDEATRVARAIVPDNQLSLAIGKEGQNARLAAKLTGWKIDIKSDSQARALEEEEERLAAERAAQEQESQPGEPEFEKAPEEESTPEAPAEPAADEGVPEAAVYEGPAQPAEAEAEAEIEAEPEAEAETETDADTETETETEAEAQVETEDATEGVGEAGGAAGAETPAEAGPAREAGIVPGAAEVTPAPDGEAERESSGETQSRRKKKDKVRKGEEHDEVIPRKGRVAKKARLDHDLEDELDIDVDS
ncbi:MAG: transcription termination factor NusA [Bacillota bacterium]|nr:transcription termination factor NusA [Bacillota bacterium]